MVQRFSLSLSLSLETRSDSQNPRKKSYLFLSRFDVPFNLGQVSFRNRRSDQGVFLERISDLESLHFRYNLVDESIVNRLLYEYPGSVRAYFALRVEVGVQSSFDSVVQLRVVEYQQWTLAAQFQGDSLQASVRTHFHDPLSSRYRASERDLRDVAVITEDFSSFTFALNDVEDASR